MKKGVSREEYQRYIQNLKKDLEIKKAMYKILETEIITLENSLEN